MPREIFHLSASEIMFAGAQRDWPLGGGWYQRLTDGAYAGPYQTKEQAAAAHLPPVTSRRGRALLASASQSPAP